MKSRIAAVVVLAYVLVTWWTVLPGVLHAVLEPGSNFLAAALGAVGGVLWFGFFVGGLGLLSRRKWAGRFLIVVVAGRFVIGVASLSTVAMDPSNLQVASRSLRLDILIEPVVVLIALLVRRGDSDAILDLPTKKTATQYDRAYALFGVFGLLILALFGVDLLPLSYDVTIILGTFIVSPLVLLEGIVAILVGGTLALARRDRNLACISVFSIAMYLGGMHMMVADAASGNLYISTAIFTATMGLVGGCHWFLRARGRMVRDIRKMDTES